MEFFYSGDRVGQRNWIENYIWYLLDIWTLVIKIYNLQIDSGLIKSILQKFSNQILLKTFDAIK